jgi:acyl-CoA synthetase (AMP-forming)/AMP-acid ligase II
VATGTSPDDDADTAAETVGRPAPGVEVRVLGEPGAVGPLQLRSPGAMSGYWDDPAATAAAMTADGWIDTGDLARLRTDGNLILAGRAAEMYIRNGYNVHPLEVERTLQEHPAVQAAAVVGVRAPVAGEQGVAFVVASATPDELRAWCRDRLASYKIPAHIELVAALPTNAMSKVDKRALRAIAGHLL